MKRLRIISLVSFVVVMCTAMYGQSWVQGWTPFDNFNQEFLNPTKWLQTPACPYWTQELECVREIQFGQLRLAVRNYGDPNSNVGVQNGNSALYFSNPAAIDGFMSTVVIRRTSATACVANMGAFANAQAILAGSFFNNGTYDVWAFLTMGHDPSMDKGIALGQPASGSGNPGEVRIP